jgi:GH43 family beta-xylosidase
MNTVLNTKNVFTFLFLLLLVSCQQTPRRTETDVVTVQEETYTNPILPTGNKPWAIFKNGYYYYTQETARNIEIWKTKDITDLRNAIHQEVWLPTDPKAAHNLWAPEIHYINNKWYLYYEADDGNSDNHQIYVAENSAKDPLEGKFISKGRISTDKDNNWGIHPNVIQHNGSLYMTWSGWQSRRVSVETQCIYIAKMKNPWTLESDRVLLSKPELEWERQWINPDGSKTAYTIYVNEAPQFFHSKNKDKIYIFYSASGLWTPFYAIGKLTADANSDLLNPASWKKSERPVFKQVPQDSIYSTGNCCFIPSPDGKEYYMLYHARKVPNEQPPGSMDSRTPRLQKIEWSDDGTPYLGVPIPESVQLQKPSGTKEN